MTKLCVDDRIKISILGGGRMVKIQKIVALILIALLVLLCIGCAFFSTEHSELKCVERKLGIELRGAVLVESYQEMGFDGSICYHAFSVNDELKKKLEGVLTTGVIPTEAKGICEASSHVNSEVMYVFPEMDYGSYYYDYFNDGENSRVCYALLDTTSDILYYFFASGQAIQYPNGR